MGSTVDTHPPPVLEVRIKESLDSFLKEEGCPALAVVLNADLTCSSVRLESADI